jgi:hypothetical protein
LLLSDLIPRYGPSTSTTFSIERTMFELKVTSAHGEQCKTWNWLECSEGQL